MKEAPTCRKCWWIHESSNCINSGSIPRRNKDGERTEPYLTSFSTTNFSRICHQLWCTRDSLIHIIIWQRNHNRAWLWFSLWIYLPGLSIQSMHSAPAIHSACNHTYRVLFGFPAPSCTQAMLTNSSQYISLKHSMEPMSYCNCFRGLKYYCGILQPSPNTAMLFHPLGVQT